MLQKTKADKRLEEAENEGVEVDLDEENTDDSMDPIEMLVLVQAYETWLYEKEFQHAMEAIYTD